ncbi:AP-3 complex subunit beta-1 [Goodea atripinnis]|uniref:AP-3 complex subunit beta-1 n=1 Tax=Goodea atripinnis TaxID=208336 RepID=A0ABV0NXZ1_9TELE
MAGNVSREGPEQSWRGGSQFDTVMLKEGHAGFAGRTISSGALVLVTLELRESSTALLTINTEKSVMASMLLRDLKQALSQA